MLPTLHRMNTSGSVPNPSRPHAWAGRLPREAQEEVKLFRGKRRVGGVEWTQARWGRLSKGLEDSGDALKIGLTSVFVNDQARALEFYTKVLGFVKKTDISAGQYRWLTVVSPDEPNGTQVVLEPNENPAAQTFQESIFKQGIPLTMFFVSDIQKEYQRLKGLGVKFVMEPTRTPGSTIARLDDTVGNLIQITQLG